MKYTKIYDSRYAFMLLGYKYDGGVIYRDCRTTWNGNEILDGFYVVRDGERKQCIHTSTLKEAKAFVESGCETANEFWAIGR